MANRIDDDYQLLKKSVHTHLIERLDEEGIEVERAERSQVSRFIQSVVEQYVGTHRIPMASADQAMLVREMVDEVLGFGPLEPLLADDQINDILINGAKSVFVEISGVLQKVQTRTKST